MTAAGSGGAARFRATVLVIDDDPRNCELLGRLVEMEGCQALRAMNAADGLALAHEHPPDLVLLDVRMPGIDGFSACRQLRAVAAFAALPIYLATAFDDDEVWPHAVAVGASGLLAKPYDRGALRRLIDALDPCTSQSPHGQREA